MSFEWNNPLHRPDKDDVYLALIKDVLGRKARPRGFDLISGWSLLHGEELIGWQEESVINSQPIADAPSCGK